MLDPEEWIQKSGSELRQLLAGPGQDDESVVQHWLERHPAFVPGYAGRRGMSGWKPWPSALITQPRLVGFHEKVPDFCWLSVDSAELTAMLVEIEKPSKRWQLKDIGQSADLTQARDQLNSWRAWFANPMNAARFLEDYLVPDSLKDLRFRQHYILIHGSREEYIGESTRIRLRASMAAEDETMMSFDRLPELANAEYACYGCVSRRGDSFEAVAVPPTWDPQRLDSEALRLTKGYAEAVASASLSAPEQASLMTRLEAHTVRTPPSYRFRPGG
jgi:hypothetical protein